MRKCLSPRGSVSQDILEYASAVDGAEFESEQVFEDGELTEVERPAFMERVHQVAVPISKYGDKYGSVCKNDHDDDDDNDDDDDGDDGDDDDKGDDDDDDGDDNHDDDDGDDDDDDDDEDGELTEAERPAFMERVHQVAEPISKW